MFFNTHEFLFVFLPTVLAGFVLLLAAGGRRHAVWWLVFASLLFYWSLDGRHLLFLLASAIGNFILGRLLGQWRDQRPEAAWSLLCLGVLLNVAAFLSFKYAFLVWHQPSDWSSPATLAIPLGISFFTVQQIVYLIDTWQSDTRRPTLGEYLLLVTFFPYVIAGPMTRPAEILPQFRDASGERVRAAFLPSVTLFAMGLFKKVVVADNLAPMVDTVFGLAADGEALSPFDAWVGALLYTLQIYFDFSGYSDMAAGLAGMFGFRLPMNFNSPLQARSIMAFWQRWHMSMTRFFTDYVFLPLALHFTRLVIRRRIGGAAQLLLRLALPLVLTFFLVGLWHGAGSNFALFALLMSGAMAVNHAWERSQRPALPGPLAWALTMAVVVTGMTLDRAPDLAAAQVVLGAMAGAGAGGSQALDPATALAWLVVAGTAALAAPNTHQIMARFPVVLPGPWGTLVQQWRGVRWSGDSWGMAFTGLVLGISVLSIAKASQFIYYRF